jgi:hypothetical protein
MLLCGNGHGFAGMKLLRGMYERAVTARYIHLYPDSADDFLDFHWITRRKLADAIQRTFGDHLLPPDKLREVEGEYSRCAINSLLLIARNARPSA